MSNEETAPLNPATVENTKARDPKSNPSNDELHGLLAIAMGKKKRTPLHILILHGLSFLASVGGLGAALCGYFISLTGPLDDQQRKQHTDSYDTDFVGMRSVVLLLAVNIIWSAVNFYLACKGLHEYPQLLNLFYSLFMGISLVVFEVINMLRVLLDHVACNGAGDKEMEMKCDAALLKLLIAEMIAIRLGFLVAQVLSFVEGEIRQFAVDLIDIDGDEVREPSLGSVSQGI